MRFRIICAEILFSLVKTSCRISSRSKSISRMRSVLGPVNINSMHLDFTNFFFIFERQIDVSKCVLVLGHSIHARFLRKPQ